MTSAILTRKKNVLVVISTMGQFPEMYRIADLLKKSKNFNPLIYFNLSIDITHTNVQNCLTSGLDVLGYTFGFAHKKQFKKSYGLDAVKNREQKLSLILSVSRNYYAEFKRYFKFKYPVLFNFVRATNYHLKQATHSLFFLNRLALLIRRIRKESKYLDLYNVKLIVFAEDSLHYYTPWLIKSAHKKNIKSVVFPYTFANQLEFLEEAHFHNRLAKNGFTNLAIGWLYPKWTYKYKNKKLLKIDSSLILISEIYDISPPNPWVMNSGFSDVIAVESQFMKRYYSKAGIPDSQMLETGFPSLDSLYEVVNNRAVNRQRFSLKYKLNDKKPWILCAVPPSQWPRHGVGFKTYDNFLNDFFMFFKKFNDVEFIFKFHPREPIDDILKICDQYNIKYVEDDTVELIGLSDMYIASVSSTIRWALAIGLPTINYDMYNYNYGDFDSAKNYYTVVKFDEFKNLFKGLHDKLTYSASLNIDNFQQKFALLDGRAGLRILNLFTELTND